MARPNVSPARSAKRVLIVGSDVFDTVGDSYHRALRGHYEVRIFNPESPTGRSATRDMGRAVLPRAALSLISNLATRDPHALSYPGLVRIASAFAPDLVIVTHMATLPPRVVSALRSGNRRAKVLGVFSDHIADFARGNFFGADYDALFFKDHYIVDKMRRKFGWTHVHYLPQACDPELHRPVEMTQDERRKYECDITIAGSMRYDRAARFVPLLGRDLKIWGPKAPRWFEHPIETHMQNRVVTGDEKCKAMLAARIVLNANHFAEIAGTNKRTFEVAAIGAFQLTDTPALADVFDPDREVAQFDSAAEMVEKIDFYLARPELRAEMSARSRARALREHTYAHRWVAKMLALGLDIPPTFPVQAHDVVVRAA